MPKKLSVWLSYLVVLLAGLFIMLPVASAHTMPPEALEFSGIKPGLTLAQVKDILGEPVKVDSLQGDGVRLVKYFYGIYKEPAIIIIGRTGQDDTRPEEELKVAGFTLNSRYVNDLQMVSAGHFQIGDYYKLVVEQYGEGQKMVQYGKTLYVYAIPNTGREITLTMGPENIITKITVATEL